MSVQKPPDQSFQIGAVIANGSPIQRPYGSAEYCQDFRIMKDNWLRLRGGHVARYNTTAGIEVLKLHRVQTGGTFSGANSHLASIKYGSSDVRMLALGVAPFSLTEGSPVETILTTNVVKLANEPTPICDAGRYVVFANGYGFAIEAFGAPTLALVSVPYLSSYSVNDGKTRFFGLRGKLDLATGLGATPSLSFAAGSGGSNYNTVATSVKIYMGLHNTTTGHYSDGILVGTQGPTGGTGKITVNACNLIVAPYHDASEQGELKYVFFASIDSLQVPYLIMNSDLTGPFTADYGTANVDLNIKTGTDNGWDLDLTHRVPVNNSPPRPMDCIWYAGGRMYGIVASAVVNVGTDFRIADVDRNGIVFSEASGSSQTQDFLGDPLQAWPAKNFSRTPNGEVPMLGMAAPDKQSSIVWTASAVFIVREQADGTIDWDSGNPEQGLFRPSGGPARCAISTQRGIVWLTQRKQLAIFTTDYEVKIPSDDLDALSSRGLGDNVGCLSYVYDPVNQLEGVDIYSEFTYDPSGSAINAALRYDFNVGFYWARDPYIVRAAERIADASGKAYHLICGTRIANNTASCAAFYSKEGQPDASYAVRTEDEQFASSGSQTKGTAVEIGTATWRSNWIGFGDPSWRKQIDFVDIIGDGEPSPQLSNASPLGFSIVQGFRPNSGAISSTLIKRTQEPLEQQYRFNQTKPFNTWWKFIITLVSHASEYGDYYPSTAFEGSMNSNFYGCVLLVMPTIGATQIRKG